jgi:hypothetical protein
MEAAVNASLSTAVAADVPQLSFDDVEGLVLP